MTAKTYCDRKDGCTMCDLLLCEGSSKYDPDEFFHHKRQTNADRIRAYTDEELAEFLMFVEHRFSEFDRITWLDWLKQEAAE